MSSFNKDLKMAVASNIENMVSRHLFTFPKNTFFGEKVEAQTTRVGDLEWAVKVKTQEHGYHHYRLRIQEMM